MIQLRQFVTWFRTRFAARWGHRDIPQRRPAPGRQGENPAAEYERLTQALHDIWRPQHKSVDEVCIQPINQDGRFPEKGEEFRRDGNIRTAHFRRALVETASGSVVRPDDVRGRCQICSGFEDQAIAFCACCGRCCCRRCQRRFTQGGTEVVLCPTDFFAACDAVNTWTMLDQSSANRPNQRP